MTKKTGTGFNKLSTETQNLDLHRGFNKPQRVKPQQNLPVYRRLKRWLSGVLCLCSFLILTGKNELRLQNKSNESVFICFIYMKSAAEQTLGLCDFNLNSFKINKSKRFSIWSNWNCIKGLDFRVFCVVFVLLGGSNLDDDLTKILSRMVPAPTFIWACWLQAGRSNLRSINLCRCIGANMKLWPTWVMRNTIVRYTSP